ncbi:unnamed protein product [Rhizophagus irregularis]|uniref:Uncharacterized protein n=1 Tax=Rhizophagus irregularis TaxID=588596 RepID=A0A916E0B8_9GLOM|nr:unnamed protein product [Rhizophagus irregularis]
MGIYVPSHIVEKSQQHRINRLKLEAEATYHGMTPKHYNAHVNNIASLTHASESFHSYIPNYLKNNLRTQRTMKYPTHTFAIVSDDTAAIEYQPNKHDDVHNKNHYFSFQNYKMK